MIKERIKIVFDLVLFIIYERYYNFIKSILCIIYLLYRRSNNYWLFFNNDNCWILHNIQFLCRSLLIILDLYQCADAAFSSFLSLVSTLGAGTYSGSPLYPLNVY